MSKRHRKFPREILMTCLACEAQATVLFLTARDARNHYYCSDECRAGHHNKHQKKKAAFKNQIAGEDFDENPKVISEEFRRKLTVRDGEYWQAYRASLGLPRFEQREIGI